MSSVSNKITFKKFSSKSVWMTTLTILWLLNMVNVDYVIVFCWFLFVQLLFVRWLQILPAKMRFLIPFGRTQIPVNLFCLTCLIDWKVETVWQDLPPKCSPSRQHWPRAAGPPRSLGWLLRHPKTEKWPSTGNFVLLLEFYCFRITFVSILISTEFAENISC